MRLIFGLYDCRLEFNLQNTIIASNILRFLHHLMLIGKIKVCCLVFRIKRGKILIAQLAMYREKNVKVYFFQFI